MDKYSRKLIEYKRQKRDRCMKLLDWCVVGMLFLNILFGAIVIYIAQTVPI